MVERLFQDTGRACTAGAVVLTGDPEDLGPLASGHPEVIIDAL